MSKFSDLDQRYQRRLAALLRCLQAAMVGFAAASSTDITAVQFVRIKIANADIAKMSDSEIASVIGEFDD